MRREPSIHVRESDLIKILEGMPEIKGNIPQLVKYILTKASKHSLNNRKLLASNQKLAKKAEKVLSSSTEDAMTMAKVIFMVRRTLKHRNISIPKPGQRDYTIVKTITENANKFFEEFFEVGESKEAAYTDYIKLAISKMRNFTLNKIGSMHEGICSTFEANRLIAKDLNPELTDKAFKTYNKFVIDKVGTLIQDYSQVPDKYMYFIMVAKRCKEMGIKPELYIEAQFKGVEWRNGIPDPVQLINGKSLEYLQKYLYENDVTMEKKNPVLANKFKALLNGNPNNKK